MNGLLQKLLKKRGIKDLKELSSEERKTFENYQAVLAKEVTVENISTFCDQQIEKIEEKLGDLDNTDKKNDRLIILLTVYKSFKKLISSAENERERMEKHLDSLLKS